MSKKIQHPTTEWLETYIDKHNCSLEDAELAWWDIQIDKGNPTPFDLNDEQEKNVKEVTKGMAKAQKTVDAFGKVRTRERKPNEDKRNLIAHIASKLQSIVDNVIISNIERQVDFTYNGVEYSVTLTAHRKPIEGK